MRALVIGFGSIGRRHAGLLAGRPDMHVDLVTRQSGTGYREFRDLKEVGDLAAYGYFVIASETHLHFEQLSLLCGRMTGKTIVVEKPLFDRILPIDTRGNRVFVAYSLRFHPVLDAIREELKGEKALYANAMVGQYLPTWRPGQDYRQSYSASRGKGGGALLDLSHEIDYLQWLFGVLDPSAGLVGKVSDLEIDSDDLALALGRTRAGTAVSLSLDYLSRIPIRRLVVHTARKTLVGDLVAGTLEVASDAMAPSKRTLDASDRNLTYRRMHEALLDASGRDCCTLQEGLEVLAVVERIRKTEVTS